MAPLMIWVVSSIAIVAVVVVGLSKWSGSEPESKGTTLKKWNEARANHSRTQQLADVHRLGIIETSKAHRKAHPLADDQKNLIRWHLRNGGFLCCTDGKKFLKDIGLDDCWAGYINAWFYEYAGCCPMYAPGGDQHKKMLDKVEKLFRGEYPGFSEED